MSETLSAVQTLIAQNKLRVSDHGYDEIASDNLNLNEIIRGAASAVLVEDYPDAFKGPSVLVRQEHFGTFIHVLWGLPKRGAAYVTLVTTYLPKPEKWYDGYLTRKPK